MHSNNKCNFNNPFNKKKKIFSVSYSRQPKRSLFTCARLCIKPPATNKTTHGCQRTFPPPLKHTTSSLSPRCQQPFLASVFKRKKGFHFLHLHHALISFSCTSFYFLKREKGQVQIKYPCWMVICKFSIFFLFLIEHVQITFFFKKKIILSVNLTILLQL